MNPAWLSIWKSMLATMRNPRASRKYRSSGTGSSPRRALLRAVSKPRPPSSETVRSTMRQACSVEMFLVRSCSNQRSSVAGPSRHHCAAVSIA